MATKKKATKKTTKKSAKRSTKRRPRSRRTPSARRRRPAPSKASKR